MVYFGPSRGCETCKRRRKRCDEARPSCMRCTNAKRTCGGYEDGDKLIFRQYLNHNGDLSPFNSIARKCSLPRRGPLPGTNVMAEDRLPQEVTYEEVEEFALGSFFYDYPIISVNHSLSRGYLDGLELMLRDLGLQSDLAKACKAVAFASGGIKLRRPVLMQKAEILYRELLGSFARAMENPHFANTAESVMIAMLLGLYEIVITGDAHSGNHKAHARGVAAILQIENSPLDLFGAVHFIRSSHPLVSNTVIQNCGIFSAAPHSNNSNQSLDNLLLTFGSIWRHANELLAKSSIGLDDLHQLKNEAMALDRNLAEWQVSQVQDFNPRTVGHVNQGQSKSTPAVGYWPGRVDSYFDLYVAGVWNTSRTGRLLLISLILKLSKLLNDNQDHSREHENAQILTEDIIASVPYHLAEDLHVFLRNVGKDTAISPGRPVGGLLLMHPIYVASTLLIVPQKLREHMQECLAWIGTHMGIGQASLFAKAPQIDREYFANGCMIVWAGMLV